MSLVDAYQEEFDGKLSEARKALDELASLDGKDSALKNRKATEVNQAIDAMSASVKQQELEARTLDKESKRVSLEIVSRNKDTITNMKQELNSAIAKVDRSGLMGGRSGEDRSRLISANEKLANQNVTIERLHRIVGETEEVAGEITEGLAQNRETIQSIKGKVWK